MENKNMLGAMIDCSRNGVMKVRTVKKYADLLSAMGYNTLMLYTEDTFEVDNQPFFGHLRGRYTKEEMKELDAYCEKKGIELIPCIQTLAHLNCIFKWWDSYEKIRDCDDILLIDDENTHKLLEDIFATLAECFKTRKIHIGMDEAYRVGLGKYLSEHGYSNRFDLINKHLHKVCEIANKYGFEPMIWSDMFCKLALDNDDYYAADNLEEIREKAALPQNVSLVYWDYYSTDVERYKRMFAVNKAFDRPVIFAGGAWTWKGFAPDNKFSIDTTIAALKGCRESDVNDILITIWGDDGNECSRFAVLPALFYTSELAKGNEDEADIKAKFQQFTGIPFDDFMLLDEVNGKEREGVNSAHKYLLYDDAFMGIYDFKVEEGTNEYYKALKEKLEKISVPEDYKRIFDYCTYLCDVLSVKSELGVKTRSIYRLGDNKALRDLALNDYTLAIEKIKAFHKVYENFWMWENKPFGFEIQDMRLGGLISRLESCKQRLIGFCDGKLERIDELEEDILPCEYHKTWGRLVSPSVLSHLV
ncbi:MAG: beta-N-acetylhexosaminidase [Clostridia bacterium]|nr:beta-N-acetylhexosaminidase [Clostridia bacterium]